MYDKLFTNFFGKTAEQQKEEEDLKLYGWAFKMENMFDFELKSIGHKPLILKTETKSTVQDLLWMALVQIKSGSVPTKDRVQIISSVFSTVESRNSKHQSVGLFLRKVYYF